MKNTVATIMKQKSVHDRIAMLTAYDYSTARLIDEAGVEMILVGRFAGNGYAGIWRILFRLQWKI